MENKNYSISEVDLEPNEAKEIISKLIDAQINTYRLQVIQDWEKKHDKGARWNREIKRLEAIRSQMNQEIENHSHSESLLRINLSFHLNPIDQQKIRKVS